MKLSSGHWYPILSCRELKDAPVAKTRFGRQLVFWRDRDGHIVCLEDRCAHRGAALSLGKLSDGAIECPFHGFRYDRRGRCIRVPAEGDDWQIPEKLRVNAYTVIEGAGYVWTWRGPAVAAEQLPALPQQPILDGLVYSETRSLWNNHYTRCIENVIDYSHLPFVHRRNIGAFIRDPVTKVSVKSFDDGFRFYLLGHKEAEKQFVEFTYPTLWANRIGKRSVLATTFMPVDDHHAEVYFRWYHALPAILQPLMEVWGRISQYIVFKDDLPIVSSQRPGNVDDAANDKLVPSDAGLVAFRKLRRAHQEEIRAFETMATADAVVTRIK